MQLYWTYRHYTLGRAIKAYILGMVEFRRGFTTHFFDYDLQLAYEAGRDKAHQLTLRVYDDSF